MKRLAAFLVLGMLAVLAPAGAEEDIKRILRRAGTQWAEGYGTSITTGALASGFCFSRDDYTDNEDKCLNQPTGFSFIEYGQAVIGKPSFVAEPKIGTMIKSSIRCDVPDQGVAMTCQVGSSNAKASSTSVANEKAFSFGQDVTVEACFGAPPLAGSLSSTSSFEWSTAETNTKSDEVTDTALASVSITVPPGQCIDLEIRSIPTTKEGFVPYYIPLDGAISVWLEDAIATSPDSGNHFNWNIPVSDMIEIAENGDYSQGLQNGPTGFFGRAKVYEITYKSEVAQQPCSLSKSSARFVEGIFEPAPADEAAKYQSISETPRIIYPPSAAEMEETAADDSSPEVTSAKPAEEDTSNANDNTAKSESIDDSSAMPESPPDTPSTSRRFG